MEAIEALDSTSIISAEGRLSVFESLSITSPAVISRHSRFPLAASTGSLPSNLIEQTDHSQASQELQSGDVLKRLLQPQKNDEPSRVTLAREHRLELLAKKYEGTALSREDEARIAILTQRLRRLAPRVSHVAWTIAEESVAQLESVSERINEISKKYGL